MASVALDLDLDYLPHFPPKTDYGIGCIGAGFIMRDIHLVAYKNAGFNVVAIASRTPAHARACAEARGIETVYDTWQELLDDPRVEILDIAFPPDQQPGIIAEAVKRPHIKGILAQKPLAILLHIEHLLARKPARLSGGERQRVAIGRALVRRPRAYLMDEPLANLDARLRLEMRVELKHLQKDLGQTFLYVTNDQIEALSMADRMAVLNKGVLQQCDEPDVIYRLPANRFVATIVGSPPMNFLPCTLAVANGTLTVRHEHFVYRPADESGLRAALAGRSVADGRVWLGVRPEDIGVYEAAPTNEAMLAEVVVLEPLGQETIVDLRLGREIIKARVPPTRRLHEHQTVWITFDPAKLHLFDAVTDTRLYTSTREQPLLGGRKTL